MPKMYQLWLFSEKYSSHDINATNDGQTADSTLRFKYRLLNSTKEGNSEEKVAENLVSKQENFILKHEPISQPSEVIPKFYKAYSYSPLPMQSDPHPAKVIYSLPANPATKDLKRFTTIFSSNK